MAPARIDGDVFPFTEAELRAALAQVMPAAQAGADAARHARGLRAQRRSRYAFHARVAAGASPRLAARTLPATDVPVIGVVMYVWPEMECLALLHAFSPALAARVDAHRGCLAASSGAHDHRLADDAAWRRAQRRVRRLLVP